MKAFVRTEAESQEVELREVPLPKYEVDEMLIKVEAFGVGIHDRYFIPQEVDFPYIIGSEGAGIITKLGKNTTGFKIGDRVIFSTSLQPQGGSWAEYAAAKQKTLILLPDNVSFAEGAAVPVAGKTALECMRELQLSQRDKLFIAGASGAIGTMAIQLAAIEGVRIAASASEKNHAYMKSLGAEKTVDYNDQNWQKVVKEWAKGGVDATLAIQPETGPDSIGVIKDGGKLITVSGYNTKIEPVRNIIVKQMEHHQETQLKVVELVNAISRGEIKIVIEKEYTFDQALKALEKTETRHARGKLVVKGLVKKN